MAREKNLYVIRLDNAVLDNPRFRKANPAYRKGKPCYYVGVTSRSPDERFRQHKEGYKASRWVKKYGKWIARRKFKGRNPVPGGRAKEEERKLARELREKGYGVWQN